MREIVDYIAKEWAVLRGAPFSFIGLTVLCLVGGVGLASWHYSERISATESQSNAKDAEIGRYRVALGIDKASPGNLIELAPDELKAKAMNTSSQIREFCFSYRSRSADLDAQFKKNKTSQEESFMGHRALAKEFSQDFDRKLKADSFNVDNELRRRLGPKAVAAIVGISPSIFSASDGTPLDILQLAPSSFGVEAEFACVLADGIEQMAKLLPSDDKR